jgi:integrase
VFCHPLTGTHLDRSEVTRRFQKALKAAKLPDLTFHELRHTFGTTMAANPKVSPRQLQEWLGHADLKTTQIYTHYSSRGDEAQTVDESFAGLGTNPGTKLRRSTRGV